MELRYCEECGDVIRVETQEPPSLADHFICGNCKSGAGAAGASPGAPAAEVNLGEASREGKLNLFSNDTVALRKKQLAAEMEAEKSKGTHLRLVTGEEAVAPGQGEGSGSVGPARAAQKILFRCLHCRATLSIRPVEKTSKLTCPHCAQAIYVTPAGKLHKLPPSGSFRKGEGLLTEAREASNLQFVGKSVRVAPGSQAVLKSESVAVPRSASQSVPRSPSVAVPKSGSTGLRLSDSRVVAKPAEKPASVRLAAGPAPSSVAPGGVQAAGAPVRVGSFRAERRQSPVPQTPTAAPRRAGVGKDPLLGSDPDKTDFLTDESTTELSSITSQSPLAHVEGPVSILPREEFSRGLQNVAGPDPASGAAGSRAGEARSTGDAPAVGGSMSEMVRRQDSKLAVRLRNVARGGAQALVLVLCLCAPLVVGNAMPGEASAAGHETREDSPPRASWLEDLDRIGNLGVQKLLGGRWR